MTVQMTAHADDEARAKIWDMMKDIEIALLVSHDRDGQLHARPMGTIRPKDKDAPFTGEVWFMSYGHAPKVDEIRYNPDVLLNYSEPKKQAYISLAGKAEIIEDKAKIKELWSEPLRTWFPKGPDDSDIALIRIQADAAEYWDAPSSAVVYAYGYFKARLTGKAPHPGENRKVAM